jgi:hypothetical protein
LRIYDVSNPYYPISVADTVPDGGGNADGVFVCTNYAYLANDSDGLRIYDVSTPTNPVPAGYAADTNNGGIAFQVAVSHAYAYMANYNDGLRIYALQPQLTMTPAATNVLFSWPAPAGFWLQQNSNLATTNWITCTNLPVVMGGSNQISMPQPYGSAFYRLMSK